MKAFWKCAKVGIFKFSFNIFYNERFDSKQDGIFQQRWIECSP